MREAGASVGRKETSPHSTRPLGAHNRCKLNPRLRCSRRGFISAPRFDPTIFAGARVARILRLGGRHNAQRKVDHDSPGSLDLLSRSIAPKNTGQHAAARHCDIVRAVPGGNAVVLPARHGKYLLPPTVQAFAFIGADDECAVPRFTARLGALKLWDEFLRAGRRSSIRQESRRKFERRNKRTSRKS